MHTCIHAYMHTCIHAYMHTCIHAYMHTCIHAYMQTGNAPARNRYSGACGQRPKRLQMMLDTCHSARCECNTVRKHERRLFLLYCPFSQVCPERKQVKLLQQRLRCLAELRAEDLRCREIHTANNGAMSRESRRACRTLGARVAKLTATTSALKEARWGLQGIYASMSSVHLLQAPAIVLDEANAPPCIKSLCEPLGVKLFQYLAPFARTSHDQPRKEMMSRWCPTFGTHNGTRMANCCAWWSHWVGISAHALRWQLVSACRVLGDAKNMFCATSQIWMMTTYQLYRIPHIWIYRIGR